MTWEIFIGIASLVAFLIPIMTVVVKLTKTLATIQVSMRTLSALLEESRADNRKSHERIFTKLNALENTACRHETKILNLERM